MPAATRIGGVSFDAAGKVATTAELTLPKLSDGPIRVVGKRIFNREKELTGDFPAIHSLDFSESRGEVAFSAVGVRGFDIGLVSSDGSKVNWVPQDPADELAVQWAPRGNKISYIVRGKGGDLVRTVHVPTSAELTVPFPNARIHALAWDAAGAHYAVAYSTPDASDRVEMLEYDGDARKTVVQPSTRVDAEVEPFVRDAILLRPRDLRYGEKVPVVVWAAPDFAWNDARAALMKDARVALVVTTRAPDDALWAAIEATPWIDAGRSFNVGSDAPQPRPSTVAIVGDASVPAGRYQRSGNVVAVAPAAIQSFAAGFIADQSKRISPTNVR